MEFTKLKMTDFFLDLTDNILEVFYQKIVLTLIKILFLGYSLGSRIQIYAEFEQESAPLQSIKAKSLSSLQKKYRQTSLDLVILPKKQ